jgi:NAD(P)-dependent dehydrogenase (short-subunit alcohol dehydrogenase family)
MSMLAWFPDGPSPYRATTVGVLALHGMVATDNTPVPNYLDLLRLDGRGYVVLGAGQGMGRQTCHALTQAGASKIVCVDIEQERADDIAQEIGIGVAWAGDVTKRAEAQRLGEFAEAELGTIAGFVDIVGMARWAAVLDVDDDNWNWSHDMNVRHAYLVSQELGRRMVASGGGTMVFIASVSGLSAAPMHAAYGAAKAGLMAYVQTLAVELAPHGVRANAVAPGTILTPRMDAIYTDEQRAANTAVIPLGRMGRPADIAGAALYLTSDLSSFVSGRTIVVDGAVDAKFPYGTL